MQFGLSLPSAPDKACHGVKAAAQKLIKEDLGHPSLLQTKQSCIVEELAPYYNNSKEIAMEQNQQSFYF